ncbi:MAG: trypsin-like peptidase domain-containing protein [Oscillospiraceae bacterium]|nr:trypsin-like peptidase domain-containing protein [Oscillospiraceae bacterium]
MESDWYRPLDPPQPEAARETPENHILSKSDEWDRAERSSAERSLPETEHRHGTEGAATAVGSAAADRSAGRRDRAKRRPSAAARAVGCLLLLLLAIAASSLALQKDGDSDIPMPSAGEREELPDLPKTPSDFFSKYYTAVETDTAEVGIEPVDRRPEGEFELQPEGEELSLQELYEHCAPTVVAIAAYEKNKVGYNWGSGVILRSDGIILTNTHVVENCTRAEVTLPDDRVCEAKLIGADSVSDIALLKIEAENLPAAEFGESAMLQVGDSVAAIGNPLGETFRNTLTDGIISAIERGMTYHGRSMTLIQTNTAINEGNSGGALFNRSGQVVGITNMKMMSSYSSIEGIGFAIPSATACEVVNALLRDGEVRGRPSVGITVGAIPTNAMEKYGLPEGLYVSAVTRGSDAEKQGIKAGDIVLAVNGTPVTTTAQVSEMKNALSVGDTMTFRIWRNGETMEITVTLMDTNDIYG